MKVSEAIERVKKEKPHSFSEDHCAVFLTEIENRVQAFLGMPATEFVTYTWADGDRDMIVPAPYDAIYISWLKANIDYALEEYESYANNQARHTDDFDEFKRWAMQSGMVSSSKAQIRNWRW